MSRSELLKIVYFDEEAATDYITIKNGGHIDWNTTENKEKLAKILAQIDATAKGRINIFSLFKASLSGNLSTNFDAESKKIISSTLTNTLLTDYISLANKDKNIYKFHNESVYAPTNSISMYKMYSSYLNIVPKELIPINIDGLNNALLGERGYYQMLLSSENEPSRVLRFNINSFKNNYSLADLSKMNLSFYGVKVGSCTKEQLLLEKEFEFNNNQKPMDAQEIINGSKTDKEEKLIIFDIVLAGVMILEE